MSETFSKAANTMNQRLADGENITVDLDLDDGRKVSCAVLLVLTVQKKDYIVLMPLDEKGEGNEEGEIWFYGYKTDPENEDAEPELLYISDDDEYEAVADAFDEYLDDAEFDELIEEESGKTN